MTIHRRLRFRIYPTPEQASRLERWSDALRFLWNLANEQRHIDYARHRNYRDYPTGFDQINELTALRKELPWLADVPRNACAQLLIELDKAWQLCFERVTRTPRWKQKGRDAIALCETHSKSWRFEDDTLHFPKIGSIRAVVHRPLEGTRRTCTIKRDGDQWFVTIVCKLEQTVTLRTEPVVALDRGVVNMVADSDGRTVEAPRYYRQAMKRLAHAERRVSRRKKGSKNREKAKRKVMRIHRKVRRQREDFLHKLSHGYANSHGVVVIEKLQVSAMCKTPKGRHLSRSIFDAGWGLFAEMLRYKLAWSGGTLIEVPAAYSSQTCSECGVIDVASRSSQAVFLCTSCGHSDHADLNAAKVLKSRANRSALPVEGSLKLGTPRNRKQLRVARRSAENFSV